MNKNQNTKTPATINYQVQEAIEQMVSTLPQGTDLGLCDVISAMYSGYFIESGGGVMPAVDQYLSQTLSDEKERAARSRRAAKAVTHGQYNLNELIEVLKRIVKTTGQWEATKVQGYCLKPVDMTAYKRSRVKGLKSKRYDSDARRAVAAVPFGMIGATGKVGEQRVALLEQLICGDIDQTKPSQEMEQVYKKVATCLTEEDIAIFEE